MMRLVISGCFFSEEVYKKFRIEGGKIKPEHSLFVEVNVRVIGICRQIFGYPSLCSPYILSCRHNGGHFIFPLL
ncbi:MAG: hypothetical protein Q8O44_01895, partial [Syntrophales bacterium]|nr:hypothetical protein [Syntrophales bacterium]